ncbi:MAG: hypothetical protein Q9159_007313 [Coniocarpon cinnabarinum]
MGGRLSTPRSPSGSEESTTATGSTTLTTSDTRAPKSRLQFRPRLLIAPLSALLLGSMIFVYSRTTVAAAKENARRAREADGGSISWRREGMRRHGRLDKVEERTLWGQFMAEREGKEGKEGRRTEGEKVVVEDRNPIEEGIRRAREGRGRGGRDGGRD